MKINVLPNENFGGYTHEAIITHADLTEATAATAQVIELLDVKVGSVVQAVDVLLVTPFEHTTDAAFDDVAITVGDGATADRFLAAAQVNKNGTEVLAKGGTGTRHAYVAADTVDITFNSMTGKSLVNLDKGELKVFLKVAHLS